MPMILVKKNPRGKVIRELSSEEETAVKTVCGLKRPATMAQHNLANDLLREMREYDAWLQCDCIPGDSPAMNFAALKNNTGTLYLSSFNHEHAPECPMYRQLSGNVRIPLYSITDWHRSPISDSHPFDQPGT